MTTSLHIHLTAATLLSLAVWAAGSPVSAALTAPARARGAEAPGTEGPRADAPRADLEKLIVEAPTAIPPRGADDVLGRIRAQVIQIVPSKYPSEESLTQYLNSVGEMVRGKIVMVGGHKPPEESLTKSQRHSLACSLGGT